MSGPTIGPLTLLVVALAAERRAVRRALREPRELRQAVRPAVAGRIGERDVILVQAGVGRDAAHSAVIALSRGRSVEAVWSLGFAGGLVDTLRPGDLVCPATLLDGADPASKAFPADSSHAAISAALRRAGLAVDAGPILSVAGPLRTPGEKRCAHRASGAVAVEMEAAGVARAARELGIPWLALKAVVDGVEDALPPALARCVTSGGDLAWTGLLAGLLRGPGFWRALRHLERSSRLACRSLRRGLEAAGRASAALTPS